MNWTPERVELLRKLWSEGLSASQIAFQLGGVSRNAVIGKVHRLKLSSRGRAAPIQAKQKKATPATPKKPRKRVNHAADYEEPKAAAQKLITPAAPEPAATEYVGKLYNEPTTQPEEKSSSSQDVAIPISLRLKLTELTDRVCKWPNGDPLNEDFHFCGNTPKDGVCYCAYHARIAYQPVSDRRRAR